MMWILSAVLVLLAIAASIALVYVAAGMAAGEHQRAVLLVAAVLAVAAFYALGEVL
jgi:hypothetical protein